MSFFDDVKKAWDSADQNRLIGLIRLDYSGSMWEQKCIEFLAASEKAQVQSVELFRLAKQVQEKLIGSSRKLDWKLRIVPRLLNLYQGKDFSDKQWVVAAAGGELPDPAWEEIQVWVAEWTEHYLVSGKITDGYGFFQVLTEGIDHHLPGVFHPLVLRILNNRMNPAEAFTLELAEWLFSNTLEAPAAGASVGTGFAAGATALKLAAARPDSQDWAKLANNMFNTVEHNCLCDENAPHVWRGKREQVQELLDECPFWRSQQTADELRRRSVERLKQAAKEMNEKFSAAANTLPPFHSTLNDVARFPLPEYRSEAATTFWEEGENGKFTELTRVFTHVGSLTEKLDQDADAVLKTSTGTTLACSIFSKVASAPICSASLPALLSELGQKNGYATRMAVSRQMRSVRLSGSDSFPFTATSGLLEDAPGWHEAIHAFAPTENSEATLSNWLALEPWDVLRGRCITEKESGRAKDIYEAVQKDVLFTLLASSSPDLSKLPTGDSLIPLRRKLAMLTLLGYASWQDLLKKLVGFLDTLSKGKDTDAYRLVAAARLELSITAAAAGVSPAAALGETGGLADLKAFKDLLDIASYALSSEKAWEARAGFNAYILLARLTEMTGDLFIGHQLSVSISDRVKKLIKTNIKSILENRPLTGSDLPLAFAASDLVRFARERGMGIAEPGLIAPPAWWQETELSKLLQDLTEQFANEAACKQLADNGGLGLRLLLLAVMQMQLDHFERGRRLLVRPPREVETNEFVGLNTLHNLRHALCRLFCTEPLLRCGLPEDDAAWRQPEYWFRRAIGDEKAIPDDGQPTLHVVNWLDSWQSQAQTDALGRAAGLSANVPKRLPVGLPPVYRESIYASELLRDIDGCYEGELPYKIYSKVREELDKQIQKMEQCQRQFIDALKEQKGEISTDEIKTLLSDQLRLNTSDFREQIQARLADVRRAEAELEVAEHESLAAEFEVAANRMLTEAVGLEVERSKLDTKITNLGKDIRDKESAIAKINQKIGEGNVASAEQQIEIAKLKIEQTKIRKQQAEEQLEGIKLEIEFIKKVVGDSDKPSHGSAEEIGQYGVEIKLNGKKTFANGQMAAIALRTEEVLSKQIAKQIQEAEAAKTAAEKEEEKARKRAKRNKLITSVCSFIGSVVGSIYGGPAGAALGAEIGKAVAELAIGVMDNKPPMDILTGLTDNAFAIADKAGYNLETELNTLGDKVAGELGAYMKDIEGKIKPLLADMPKIFDAEMMQGALEVLGLEELGDASELSNALYQGIKDDLENLGQIGTTLKGASGLERAKDLEKHLKKHLVEKTDNALTDIRGLAGRVGEQIDRLTDLRDPTARREVLERTIDKVMPLVKGAIATQVGQFRQRKIAEWISGQRSKKGFWNDETVQKEGRELLQQLFPDNEEVRAKAAVNMAQALMDPKLYRAQMQEHLSPYQTKQDELIQSILHHEPKPSGSGSAFWGAQVNYLNEVKEKFNNKLFPFMEGDSERYPDHPRIALFIKLETLKNTAIGKVADIDTLIEETKIDEINEGNAEIKLEQAKNALQAAAEFVEIAELNVAKESLLMQISEISFKKASILDEAQKQAENTAQERAKAAKAKIKAAQAELEAKHALLNGARRFGIEAGRIRSGLDRPAAVKIEDGQLNKARREYIEAFHQAMTAYRELVRYCLATFFSENGQSGTKLPELIRPDLLTTDNDAATWHKALTSWCGNIDSEMKDGRKPRRSVTLDSFQWDLTLEQVAALTSPAGLLLQAGLHVSQEEPLLVIPADFIQEGTISEAAFKFFQEKKFPITKEAKFIQDGSLWRLFDNAQVVSVALYDRRDGRLLRRKDVRADNDPKAYAIDNSSDSDKLFYLMYWPDRLCGDRQSPKNTGRSMPSDRYVYKLFHNHANGRIVALFVEVRDDGGNPVQTGYFDIQATFTGNQWIERNEVQLQPQADLVPFRIIEDENVVSNILELKRRFRDAKQDADGDMDMSFVQGTPIAGSTNIRFLLNNLPDANKTIGSVRIAVLYKHYSAN